MDAIKPEDRQKIQAHLTEIWKILYAANGLEDKEHQRTPSSKQKERMSQMLITYNKDHSTLTEGRYEDSIGFDIRPLHWIPKVKIIKKCK